MKKLSTILLSFLVLFTGLGSPIYGEEIQEEEEKETQEEKVIEEIEPTEVPVELETPTPTEEPVVEEETIEESEVEEGKEEEVQEPKHVISFIDWIDEGYYPDLIHNATGNVYLEIPQEEASYEGMKNALPTFIYGYAEGSTEVQPFEVVDWEWFGSDEEVNFVEYQVTNHAFRPILANHYIYDETIAPLLSLHVIGKPSGRPMLKAIGSNTNNLTIINSEYDIPEKYRHFTFGANTVLSRKNLNSTVTIYKTKYQRYIDGKMRDLWVKETAVSVDPGMTSRYNDDQWLAVGTLDNKSKGSVTMRYDFYYYDNEGNEQPIKLAGFTMINNLDKASNYWDGTDIPDAVTATNFEHYYVYKGNYLGISGNRIYGTDVYYEGNNQPAWGSDTWKKMSAIIAFDTSSLTLKLEAGYARGVIVDSWEYNYKIETEVVNGKIDPTIYGISAGSNVTIQYEPNEGYDLAHLYIDGQEIDFNEYMNSYSFYEVTGNHKIKVVYEITHDITTEAINGTIDPDLLKVPEGESRTIHYAPNEGYILDTIEIDQEKINPKEYPKEYEFKNIMQDHHIKITFVKQKDPTKIAKDNNKVIGNKMMVEGELVIYEITVENPTQYDRSYTVTDTLPEGITYVSSSHNGKEKEGKVVWDILIPKLDKVVLLMTVKINEKAEGEVINHVKVETEGLNPPKEVTETIYTQKAPIKRVKNEKGEEIDNQYVKKGENLYYEIEVINPTEMEKTYLVKDILDSNVEYVSSDEGTYDSSTRILQWNTKISPKETKIFHFIVKPSEEGTKIENQASIIVDEKELDSNIVTNYVPQKPLKVVSDEEENEYNQAMVFEEDLLTYYIHVKNSADSIKKVTIRDELSPYLTFLSADNEGKYTQDEVVWEFSLAPSQEKVVSFKASVKKEERGNVIENEAKVFFDGVEIPSNKTTNPIVKDPTKTVTLNGNDVNGKMVDVGKQLVYTIYFENNGNTDKTVHIEDVLPDYTKYISSTNNGIYTSDTRSLSWDLIIKANTIGSVSFTVETMRFGTYLPNIATVKVDAKELHTNKVENTTTPLTIQGDLVSVYKNSNPTPGTRVTKGQEIEYTLSVINTGRSEAKNITIYDPLPIEVSYIQGSVNENGIYEDGILTWNIPTLKPNETKTITYKVKVKDIMEEGLIRNYAIYHSESDKHEGLKTTNEVIHGVGQGSIPATLELRKTTSTSFTVKEKDEITYQLLIMNRGGEVSKDTVITDVIPEGCLFVKSKEGIVNANLKRVEWYLGDLNVGETKSVSFTVKVLNKSGSIYNQARFDNGIERMNLSNSTPKHTSNIVEHHIQQVLPQSTIKPVSNIMRYNVPNTRDTTNVRTHFLLGISSILFILGLYQFKKQRTR